MAGPGLLAYAVSGKLADYLPLFRGENMFARMGVGIPRATLSLWCRDVADIAAPVYERMAERGRAAHVVATDDTPMPMQGPGAGKSRTARMWIHRGDESAPSNVFDFTLSRKRDAPPASRTGLSRCWPPMPAAATTA